MKEYARCFFLLLIPYNLFFTACTRKTEIIAGCFTPTGENGLNIYDFSPSEGTLKHISGFNAGANPSYFSVTGNRKLIYVINEVEDFGGSSGGGLTTLEYKGRSEGLRKVSEMVIPNGGPCFISETTDNRYLLIANYSGGSVAVVKLDKKGIPLQVCDTISFTGSVGKQSHAHMVLSDPPGKRIYVTDLGLDRIMIYTLEKSSGQLIPFNEKGIHLLDGTGPRHFVFNKSGTMIYVMGELNSTVSVFRATDTEGLILLQTISTLDKNYQGKNSGADLHLGLSGSFLYASNRGENSIATYSIGKDGLLTLAGHTSCGGDWPRNFTIDPSGNYLIVANQKSGDISVFRVNKKSGLPETRVTRETLPAPACLKFLNP